MGELRLDGRVALITGAGRGLGRSHAELLASRGASVVVNDPGVNLEGEGADPNPAREVVDAIVARGGRAIANFDAVGTEQAARNMVRQALDSFGRIDIVINNAGNFMPTRKFPETTTESFQSVLNTHVMGSIHTIRAAWPLMAAQRYGKIVNVASHVGYVGTRGRLEYGTAKGALHGLTRCLAHESLDEGIYVNLIAPGAFTRPVQASTDNFDERVARAFSPALVSPTVLWLVHQDCKVNGESFTVMAGTTTRIKFAETRGYRDDAPTPEMIRDNFERILGEQEISAAALSFPTDGEIRGMELVGKFGGR